MIFTPTHKNPVEKKGMNRSEFLKAVVTQCDSVTLLHICGYAAEFRFLRAEIEIGCSISSTKFSQRVVNQKGEDYERGRRLKRNPTSMAGALDAARSDAGRTPEQTMMVMGLTKIGSLLMLRYVCRLFRERVDHIIHNFIWDDAMTRSVPQFFSMYSKIGCHACMSVRCMGRCSPFSIPSSMRPIVAKLGKLNLDPRFSVDRHRSVMVDEVLKSFKDLPQKRMDAIQRRAKQRGFTADYMTYDYMLCPDPMVHPLDSRNRLHPPSRDGIVAWLTNRFTCVDIERMDGIRRIGNGFHLPYFAPCNDWDHPQSMRDGMGWIIPLSTAKKLGITIRAGNRLKSTVPSPIVVGATDDAPHHFVPIRPLIAQTIDWGRLLRSSFLTTAVNRAHQIAGGETPVAEMDPAMRNVYRWMAVREMIQEGEPGQGFPPEKKKKKKRKHQQSPSDDTKLTYLRKTMQLSDIAPSLLAEFDCVTTLKCTDHEGAVSLERFMSSAKGALRAHLIGGRATMDRTCTQMIEFGFSVFRMALAPQVQTTHTIFEHLTNEGGSLGIQQRQPLIRAACQWLSSTSMKSNFSRTTWLQVMNTLSRMNDASRADMDAERMRAVSIRSNHNSLSSETMTAKSQRLDRWADSSVDRWIKVLRESGFLRWIDDRISLISEMTFAVICGINVILQINSIRSEPLIQMWIKGGVVPSLEHVFGPPTDLMNGVDPTVTVVNVDSVAARRQEAKSRHIEVREPVQGSSEEEENEGYFLPAAELFWRIINQMPQGRIPELKPPPVTKGLKSRLTAKSRALTKNDMHRMLVHMKNLCETKKKEIQGPVTYTLYHGIVLEAFCEVTSVRMKGPH